MKPPLVVVVGVGSAGCAVVDRSIDKNVRQIQYLTIDSDKLKLSKSSSVQQICLTKTSDFGGLADDQAIAEQAAVECSEVIRRALNHCSVCLIVAGIGKGTGGGAAPIVANIARNAGLEVVTVPILPFSSEGPERALQAAKSLAKLRRTSRFIFPFRLESLKSISPESKNIGEDLTYIHDRIDGLIDFFSDPTFDGKSIFELVGRYCPSEAAKFGLIQEIKINEIGDDFLGEHGREIANDPLMLPTFAESAQQCFVSIRTRNDLKLMHTDLLIEGFSSAYHDNVQLEIVVKTDTKLDYDFGMTTFSFGRKPAGITKSHAVFPPRSVQIIPGLNSGSSNCTQSMQGLERVETKPKSNRPNAGNSKALLEGSTESPDSRNNDYSNTSRNSEDEKARIPPQILQPANVGTDSSEKNIISFEEGTVAHKIDHWANISEKWLIKLFYSSVESIAMFRDFGLLVGTKNSIFRLFSGGLKTFLRICKGLLPTLSVPEGRRAASIVILLLLSPWIVSQLLLSTIKSISYRLELIEMADRGIVFDENSGDYYYSHSDGDLISQMVKDDVRKLQAIPNRTALAQMEHSALGLAGMSPLALAVKSDIWAVENRYLGLSRLDYDQPPFEILQSNNPQLYGQLDRVFKSIKDGSSSPSGALIALGIQTTPDLLVKLGGSSQQQAAVELANHFTSGHEELFTHELAWSVGCDFSKLWLNGLVNLKLKSPKEIQLDRDHYMLMLATRSTSNCVAQSDNIAKLYKSLEKYNEAFVISDLSDGGTDRNITFINYSIIIPRTSLDSMNYASTTTNGNDPINLYSSGIASFYRLDYDRSNTYFDRMSKHEDRFISAFGSYLLARSLFWQNEFRRGKYRPDLSYPWSRISSYSNDLESPNEIKNMLNDRKIHSCNLNLSEEKYCILRQLTQRADVVRWNKASFDNKVLNRLKSNLKNTPIVDPELANLYFEGPYTDDR